ncbi:MAG: cell wall-binding repeat-containing protein [Actinomycetota bacterium]|nr:cell wall-binding repeat-containing protein [Actinomycetota bacterium]
MGRRYVGLLASSALALLVALLVLAGAPPSYALGLPPRAKGGLLTPPRTADLLAAPGLDDVAETAGTVAATGGGVAGVVRDANTRVPIQDVAVAGLMWVPSNQAWEIQAMDLSGPDGSYELTLPSSGFYQFAASDSLNQYTTECWLDQPSPQWAKVASYFDDGTIWTLDFDLDPIGRFNSVRLAGRTRYSCAVGMARHSFDPRGDRQWPGVTDVVIASGDDRAAADPLAASGLCWVYDAPLFLISASSTPSEVKTAIQEIVAANGSVTVHIVGGPASVPDARFRDLQMAAGTTLGRDRILATGTRYDLAARIAEIVDAEWSSRYGNALSPPVVLMANGADPSKFFDALALSPIARATGFPILLVQQDGCPGATRAAWTSISPGRTIVAGGPATVSGRVVASFRAERWSGNDRYETAAVVSMKSTIQGWLNHSHRAIAAKLPDALTGGSMIGREQGTLLLTRSDGVPTVTRDLISYPQHKVYVLGGELSVVPATKAAIDRQLKRD